MSGSSSDADAGFERVLAQFGPALRRVAASYERVPAHRDDLVQELALALWRALPQFRGESSLRTFVFRVAHNRAISYACRARRPASAPEEAAADVADPREGPEACLARRQARDRLAAAVHTLPIVQRQVVSLTLEGLAPSEIAQVLGLTENAVAIRLTRARKALREALGVSS